MQLQVGGASCYALFNSARETAIDSASDLMMTLEAIRYDGRSLSILNQLILPSESVYEEVQTSEDAWTAIRNMKVGVAICCYNVNTLFCINRSEEPLPLLL